VSEDRDYQAIFRRAGELWIEGAPDALAAYERGISLALEAGDLPAALRAHQRLLAWRLGDLALHERVARAIAVARDKAELSADSAPALERVPLFSGVPREELVSLLMSVEPVRYKTGQTIVREGAEGDSLYLIAAGTVRVATRGHSGEEIPLATLGQGEFFGEVSLLTGRPRTATVTADTPVELLRLDRATIEGLRARHPNIEASLSEFHRRRAEKTVEALIERMKSRGGRK
jgi:hypothetical protein